MHYLIPVAVVEEFNQAFNKAKTFKYTRWYITYMSSVFLYPLSFIFLCYSFYLSFLKMRIKTNVTISRVGIYMYIYKNNRRQLC